MIDVIDFLFNKLVVREMKNGIKSSSNLVTDSLNPSFYNSNFPDSLNEYYRQVNTVQIKWIVSEKEEKRKNIMDRLQDDSWLKENYLDDDEISEEYFSGLIKIQTAEDILNPKFCKNQAYYSVIDSFVDGENPDDYIPFDIHWSLTACLKRENGKILDNIWIVYMDAESMFNMEVTIEKYLELCYKAKGFYYWPLVYYMRDSKYKEEDQHVQLMKRALPMLFPHLELDLSEFGIE